MEGVVLYSPRNILPIETEYLRSIIPWEYKLILELILHHLKYYHYGIALNSREVIHFPGFSGEKNPSADEIRICKTDIESFSGGKSPNYHEDCRVKYKYSYPEVAQRALSFVGKRFSHGTNEVCMLSDICKNMPGKLKSNCLSYCLFRNNCEHFALWCATGKRNCRQNILRHLILGHNDEENVGNILFKAFYELVFDILGNKRGRCLQKLAEAREKKVQNDRKEWLKIKQLFENDLAKILKDRHQEFELLSEQVVSVLQSDDLTLMKEQIDKLASFYNINLKLESFDDFDKIMSSNESLKLG